MACGRPACQRVADRRSSSVVGFVVQVRPSGNFCADFDNQGPFSALDVGFVASVQHRQNLYAVFDIQGRFPPADVGCIAQVSCVRNLHCVSDIQLMARAPLTRGCRFCRAGLAWQQSRRCQRFVRFELYRRARRRAC